MPHCDDAPLLVERDPNLIIWQSSHLGAHARMLLLLEIGLCVCVCLLQESNPYQHLGPNKFNRLRLSLRGGGSLIYMDEQHHLSCCSLTSLRACEEDPGSGAGRDVLLQRRGLSKKERKLQVIIRKLLLLPISA